MRTVKQRNILSKEIESSPAMEVFNTQLDEALCNFVCPIADPVSAEGWT